MCVCMCVCMCACVRACVCVCVCVSMCVIKQHKMHKTQGGHQRKNERGWHLHKPVVGYGAQLPYDGFTSILFSVL